MSSLHTFLSEHVCKDGMTPTLVSLPPVPGKWSIPHDQYPKLLELYAKSIASGNSHYFTEQHEQYRPMVIDIDFKHKSGHTSRVYTNADIMKIVQLYNDQVLHYFDTTVATCYVLEKQSPTLTQNGVLKDGLHIMYPDIVSKPNVQIEIRENVVQGLQSCDAFEHLDLENPYSDIVDDAVLKKSGWMLYGSKKNGSFPYVVSQAYTLQGEPVDVAKQSIHYWVKLFAVRCYSEDDATSLKIEPAKRQRPPQELTGPTCTDVCSSTSRETVEQLVDILNSERAEKRNTWIDVGFCLFNINRSFLDIWIRFSKQSEKFQEGECERLWGTFDPNRVRRLLIGTLFYWAQTDNPERCEEIKKTQLSHYLKKALDCTHFEVANLCYAKFGSEYVCADLKKDMWFEFTGHRWQAVAKAHTLSTKISTLLLEDYRNLGSAFKKSSLTDQNPDDDSKFKACEKLLSKVKDHNFKSNVIHECANLFYDPDFLKNLDSNTTLVGFENGVFDLEENEFRDGRPDDYISFTTGVEYKRHNHNDPDTRDLMRFLKQVLPDPDIEKYVLKLIASFLSGGTQDQKFHIWTGTGSNGKSKLMELIEDTFGDYAMKLPVTVLTMKRQGASACNPEIAKSKGKRFVSFQEPEKEDRIHVGYMKELTGGDTIMARGLYTDPIEFKPQFKMVLACNDLPDIPSTDGGTWRRLRVVNFPSKFVDDPDPNIPFHYKIDKEIPQKLKRWKPAFASLLVHRYSVYKREGIREPDAVLSATNKYKLTNDVYLEYINENITVTDDPKNHITINSLYSHYKEWYQSAFGRAPPSRHHFRDYMDERFGKANKRYGWKNIVFTETLDQLDGDSDIDM